MSVPPADDGTRISELRLSPRCRGASPRVLSADPADVPRLDAPRLDACSVLRLFAPRGGGILAAS